MPDIISSRTPEGEPNVCPVCEGVISIEPSSPTGDAPCPRCGTLLWFARTESGVRFFELEFVVRVRDQISQLIGDRAGAEDFTDMATAISWLDLDSLDMAELIMELEEQAGATFTEAERLRLAELLELLLRRSS